jgi:hypothetical protein
MKKSIFPLLLILVSLNSGIAQFKFMGNDTWITDTKTVREVTKGLSERQDLQKEVMHYDSIESINSRKCDSLNLIIAKQDHIIKRYDTLLSEKTEIIFELSQPVEVKRNKIIEFRGMITAGTQYDFMLDNKNNNFYKDLRYYVGFNTEATILNTIKIAPELQIPLKMILHAGVIVF